MKQLSFAVMAILMAVSMGCSPKKTKNSSLRWRSGSHSGLNPVGPSGTNPGSTFQPQYANLLNWDEPTVLLLASANMDESSIGSLTGENTGVALAGDIRVNGVTDIRNGQAGLINDQSLFAIFVVDSLAASGQADVIEIDFQKGLNDGSITGEVRSNHTFTLNLRDRYGAVTVTGTIGSQYVNGEIDFANSSGDHAYEIYTLGNFQVPTCAFFHCGN